MEALDAGLSVIPVGTNKRPLLDSWEEYQRRPPTEDEVQRWWKRFPAAQVALVTGQGSGVAVIDFDKIGTGWPPPDAELPTHVVVRTPRGGLHYYVRYAEGVRNSASRLAEGVDVRGEGGYVLLPPSHTDAGGYAFSVGGIAAIAEVAGGPPAAEWLVRDLLAASGAAPHKQPEEEKQEQGDGPPVKEGARNDTLFRLAVRLRKAGLGMAEVEGSLGLFNANRCRPPLDGREVVAIARSAGRYKVGATLERSVLDFTRTDTGNAALIEEMFGSRVRFDHTEGTWYVWKGRLWRPDNVRSILRAAVQAVLWRAEQAYAAPGLTDAQRAEHFAWARQSDNIGKLEAAVKLLAVAPSIATVSGQWDTEPRYLGVSRGLVDLCTGKELDPKPEMLVRWHTPVAWVPGAACPLWLRFLDEVLGSHVGLIEYVQRAVGYTLAGEPNEQVWFLMHGKGANGKSVFLRVVRHVFGEHAAVFPFSCLEARQSASVPNDLARLVGKRLALASEASEEGLFDSAKVKTLTGGEPVTARYLYKEWFEFSPRFVLWMAANSLPRVKDRSLGFWRRVRVIPFTRILAPHERDPLLAEALLTEAPGILQWAFAGLLAYRESGLTPPDCCCEAIEEYRFENDTLGEFFEACIVSDECSECRLDDLHQAYRAWANHNGVPEKMQLSKRSLGRRFAERFGRRKSHGGLVYEGCLLSETRPVEMDLYVQRPT